MFSMTISWTNPSFSALGPRSRLQWVFSEKHCHRFRSLIYWPILILYHTDVEYDNILGKVEFERSRAKARSQWQYLGKHCHDSSALIYYPISISLHSSIGYDYTSIKFAFQHDRIKVKVTMTIFIKKKLCN